MKISIVIPVYNAERFVEKSYTSILNQDLQDFEIIYIDNNSSDQSVTRIKILEENDSRVHLYHESNQGAGAARNKGLSRAKGVYVYMFDVDDEIYPNALNRMIGVLDQYPDIKAVFGKMVKSSKGITQTIKPEDETHTVIFKDPPFWGIRWFEDLKTVVGPPAFLYRKSVLETLGGYNEALRIGEDTALDIDLGMTQKIGYLDTYVYLYYKHGTSSLEQSKKNEVQIFNLWKRLTLSNLPFYLKYDVPYRYKELLFRQIYSCMGKLIFYTKGLQNRWSVYKSFSNQIKPLKVSFYFKFYLVILVLCPFSVLLKFYMYYWAPWYLNKYLNKM